MSITKTKIVCTLGPASSTDAVLTRMMQAGMDVCRLNFSHGSHESHQKSFDQVRRVAASQDQQVAILCDVQGPKIRTGLMKENFHVKPGDTILVTPESIVGTPARIQVSYDEMLVDLVNGDKIFINDGIVRLAVTGKTSTDLMCVVETGGLIGSRKGCNIPSGNLSVNVVTPKDRGDLAFIAKLNPEFVAASFVGTADDIRSVRAKLSAAGNDNIKIIAKIERPVALENLPAIIEAADGIMVARGDLGVEIAPWQVPVEQKRMVAMCNKAGKPVIVATQMLESMCEQSRPTRAEVSDVFNAVVDGADAVMLSAESSVGKHPVEAVEYMDAICASAEKIMPDREASLFQNNTGTTEAMAESAKLVAQSYIKLGLKGKLLVIAETGTTARMVSKFRPPLDIVVFSSDPRVTKELNMVWGVNSILVQGWEGDLAQQQRTCIRMGIEKGLLSEDERVIFVSGGCHTDAGASIGNYSVTKVMSSKL